MSHDPVNPSRIWQIFNNVLSIGECHELSRMVRGLSHAELDPVFDDYLVPGLLLAKGASAPDLAEFRDGLFLNAFDGIATVEQGFFSIHILHGIKAMTEPTFHIHWTHNNAAPTGDVKWNIDYSIVDGYGIAQYPAPTTISVVQTAASQYTHMITDDDEMLLTGGQIEPDSVLLGRIYRDPTDVEDTFADDAFLIDSDLHYVRDKIGTSERNRPYFGFS